MSFFYQFFFLPFGLTCISRFLLVLETLLCYKLYLVCIFLLFFFPNNDFSLQLLCWPIYLVSECALASVNDPYIFKKKTIKWLLVLGSIKSSEE